MHHPNSPADTDIQQDFLDFVSQEQAKEKAAQRKAEGKAHRSVPLKKLKMLKKLLPRLQGGLEVNLELICEVLQVATGGSKPDKMLRAEMALQEKLGSKKPTAIGQWLVLNGAAKSGALSAAELSRILRPLATGILEV
jgi:hypothetical protein